MNAERLAGWLSEAGAAQGEWAHNDEYTDEFVVENAEAGLFVSVDRVGWVECGDYCAGGPSYITTIEVRLGRRKAGAVQHLLALGAQFLKDAVEAAAASDNLDMGGGWQ